MNKKFSMPRLIYGLIGTCVTLVLMSCSSLDEEGQLTVLRVGILPDESKAELYKRYTPFFEYLKKETGLQVEVIIPDSYSELVDQFARDIIDLAYLGGFTFVQANSNHAAMPLVMRDVDTQFTSVYFVKGNSQTRDITKTAGDRLAFGSRQSTSGHLMPRYYMQVNQNIIPEKHFGSVRYSGRHDLTAYWVRDGAVDLGVANSRIIRKMLKDGRLEPQDIQVIWETPPYPDYVWAVQPDVTVKDRAKIRQAFLNLSIDNPSHTTILANLDTGGFLPASEQDFYDLKSIVNDIKAEDW